MKRSISAASTLAFAVSLTGCAGLARLIHNTFGSDEVTFERPMPGEVDLPGIQTIAVTQIDGRKEDAEPVGGWLGEWLTNAQRFQVVERARLESVAKEAGCADLTQVNCLSRVMPASAMVFGAVTESRFHEDQTRSDPYDCTNSAGKPAKCVTITRTGQANVTLSLRLVESATGKVLLQRVIAKTTSSTTTADNQAPPSIDPAPLLQDACQQAAWDFFSAISPHDSPQKVALPTDVAIPELDAAKQQVMHKQYDQAAKTIQDAMVRIDASADLDKDLKAKAHYSLGVALAIDRRYDDALQEIQRALAQHQDDLWTRVGAQVSQWKVDAASAKRQLGLATPSGGAPQAGAGQDASVASSH